MTDKLASSEDGALVVVSIGELREREKWPRALPPRPLALMGLGVLLALATIYHYTIFLPQPNVPHRLTLLDDVFALGVFGLVGLVGLVLGRRVLRLFSLTGFSRLERGMLAMGVGWGILSLGVLAIGMAHLLYKWLLVAMLLVVLAVCWRDAWRLLAWFTSAAPYRRLRALMPRGFFLHALLAMIFLEMVLLGTQALTLPYIFRGVDVYEYHWAVPQLYFLHHAIYALPGWAHANFPFNSEMLNTLALACDAPVAAVLIQAAFGVFAVILIVSFLSRHVGSLAAWLGLTVSLCNNNLAGVLISGYAEPAATCYGVASLVVVLAWLREDERSGNMGLLFLAGLLGGFGLGVKYTEGQILVGIAVLLAGAGIVRSWGLRRQGKPFVPVLGHFFQALIGYGAAALLVVLPWLLKDWLLLGNPIYPFIWGGPEWDVARTEVGVVTFAHFGPHGPLWQRLLAGFLLLFKFSGGEQNDEPFPLPPNVLYLLVLLIPLIWGVEQVWRRGRQAAQAKRSGWGLSWLLVGAIGYIIWLFSGAAVMRYALPWTLLLSVPCAALLTRGIQARWKPRLALATRVLVQGAMFLAALAAVAYTAAGWGYTQPLPLLVGSISQRQFEERSIMNAGGYWHMVDYVERHVPHDARLLLVGNGSGYFFQGFDYVDDSGEDWIPYLETEGRTPDGMLALLRRDHFRYVLYDDNTLRFVVKVYENQYLASFLPAFRQFLAGSLRQVWSDQSYHVYQVPP